MPIDSTVISDLKKRVAEHNTGNPGAKTKLGILKRVYERGERSFDRPLFKGKKTQAQWAMGRVDNFLHELASGEPQAGKSAADIDLLPDGHPMTKNLQKIWPFNSADHPRDEDGKFTSKGRSVAEHKFRQATDATYRAMTSQVIPEKRYSEVYTPVGLVAGGAALGAGKGGYMALRGKNFPTPVADRIMRGAAGMLGAAAGRVAAVPASILNRNTDTKAFADAGRAIGRKVADKGINPALRFMRNASARGAKRIGVGPSIAIGAAAGGYLGYKMIPKVKPVAEAYETWKPGQRVVERSMPTGDLAKAALRLAKRTFDESKHPRDEDGRWTTKLGNAAASAGNFVSENRGKIAAGAAGIAGAAALAIGLRNRSAGQAAMRAFSAGLDASTKKGTIVTPKKVREAFAAAATTAKLPPRAQEVMGRFLRGKRSVKKDRVKQLFAAMAGRASKTEFERKVTAKVKPFTSTLGAAWNSTVDEVKKAGFDIKARLIKEVKKDMATFRGETFLGKLKRIGEIAAGAAIVKAGFDWAVKVYKDQEWKVDKGLDRNIGFFFDFKVKDPKTNEYVSTFSFSTAHGFSNPAALNPGGSANPNAPRAPTVDDPQRANRRITAPYGIRGVTIDDAVHPAAKSSYDYQMKELIRDVAGHDPAHKGGWARRWETAVGLIDEKKRDDDEYSFRQKWNIARLLISNSGRDGLPLKNFEMLSDGTTKVGKFDTDPSRPEVLRNSISEYLDHHEYFQTQNHRLALMRLPVLGWKAGYLSENMANELYHRAKSMDVGEAAWKERTRSFSDSASASAAESAKIARAEDRRHTAAEAAAAKEVKPGFKPPSISDLENRISEYRVKLEAGSRLPIQERKHIESMLRMSQDALKQANTGKTIDIGDLMKLFDESKHKRDREGRFSSAGAALKDSGVLSPGQMASSAIGSAAWAGAEKALVGRYAAAGRGGMLVARRIAAKWIVPSLAGGSATAIADKLLGVKEGAEGDFQTAGRAIGSLGGYAAGVPFGGPFAGAILGSVAGEQIGSVVGRQADKFIARRRASDV